jgi:hypothetical protein
MQPQELHASDMDALSTKDTDMNTTACSIQRPGIRMNVQHVFLNTASKVMYRQTRHTPVSWTWTAGMNSIHTQCMQNTTEWACGVRALALHTVHADAYPSTQLCATVRHA